MNSDFQNYLNKERHYLPFTGWLTLLFIYLQLSHQIDWSWWLIWSPMLFEIAVLFLMWGLYSIRDSLRAKREAAA